MQKSSRRLLACLTLFTCALFAIDSTACTTAVVSGRATTDGRPLLWKNRDYINSPSNEVALLDEGQYRAVAVVNAGSRSSVWMGVNEAGLCIENSLSKDLKQPGKGKGPGNGSFMKRALESCATVEDVKQLLEATNESGRQTIANFGVIDAQGGAAIFETGPTSYAMFDANDPQVAPNGYLVRTNFSTTAQQLAACPPPEQVGEIYSGKRYERTCQLLAGAPQLSVPYLQQHTARDLADTSGTPYAGSVNGEPGELPTTINTSGTISRTGTVSAAVFHGVRPGEDPRLTTMWVTLGDPKFSVAVPCFPTMSKVADPLEGERGGEIGEVARMLRSISFTRQENMMRTDLLPGIWQDVLPLEQQYLASTLDSRNQWAAEGVDEAQLDECHQQLATSAYQAMTKELLEAKASLLEVEPAAHAATCRDGVTKVAIYDHSDGSANGPNNLLRFLTEENGFVAQRVTPQQVRDGVLAEFDVLIMPGGSGSSQSEHLEEAGREQIRQFVGGGGGYVGICAGSYLASTHYSWSLGILNARVWDRVHWARGTGTVELDLTDVGQQALASEQDDVEVYYGQGPLLVPGHDAELPRYEVLATYETEIAKKGALPNAMTGTHAIVRSTYGSGRVICYSPHPETKTGPNHLMAAGVKWAGGE